MIYRCAIGADHRGYFLKKALIEHYHSAEKWLDVGTHSSERTDYPLFAHAVVEQILSGAAHTGILLCGTGSGMAIAANRYKKIYAAVAWNPEIARRAREEDNCTVLILPADYVALDEAIAIVDAWQNAEYKAGRYENRIALLDS